MADPRMSDSALAPGPGQIVHYAWRIDGGETPVRCGRKALPLPTATDWAIVSCGRCQARAPEAIAGARGWCRCDACAAHGQHAKTCAVHAPAPAACSCGLAQQAEKAQAFEAEVARELREIEARRRAPSGGSR